MCIFHCVRRLTRVLLLRCSRLKIWIETPPLILNAGCARRGINWSELLAVSVPGSQIMLYWLLLPPSSEKEGGLRNLKLGRVVSPFLNKLVTFTRQWIVVGLRYRSNWLVRGRYLCERKRKNKRKKKNKNNWGILGRRRARLESKRKKVRRKYLICSSRFKSSESQSTVPLHWKCLLISTNKGFLGPRSKPPASTQAFAVLLLILLLCLKSRQNWQPSNSNHNSMKVATM